MLSGISTNGPQRCYCILHIERNPLNTSPLMQPPHLLRPLYHFLTRTNAPSFSHVKTPLIWVTLLLANTTPLKNDCGGELPCYKRPDFRGPLYNTYFHNFSIAEKEEKERMKKGLKDKKKREKGKKNKTR